MGNTKWIDIANKIKIRWLWTQNTDQLNTMIIITENWVVSEFSIFDLIQPSETSSGWLSPAFEQYSLPGKWPTKLFWKVMKKGWCTFWNLHYYV